MVAKKTDHQNGLKPFGKFKQTLSTVGRELARQGQRVRWNRQRRPVEEEARQRDERTAKAARTRKVAKADPLAEIKDALAAGTLTGPEAIDRAYRLGFAAGECAARQAA